MCRDACDELYRKHQIDMQRVFNRLNELVAEDPGLISYCSHRITPKIRTYFCLFLLFDSIPLIANIRGVTERTATEDLSRFIFKLARRFLDDIYRNDTRFYELNNGTLFEEIIHQICEYPDRYPASIISGSILLNALVDSQYKIQPAVTPLEAEGTINEADPEFITIPFDYVDFARMLQNEPRRILNLLETTILECTEETTKINIRIILE